MIINKLFQHSLYSSNYDVLKINYRLLLTSKMVLQITYPPYQYVTSGRSLICDPSTRNIHS